MAFWSFFSFGIFIGVLLGFDRPVPTKGYNTAAIINTLAVFAGGTILKIYGHDTENLMYFYIVLCFATGGIIGFSIGRFIMEKYYYPSDREHSYTIERIRKGIEK